MTYYLAECSLQSVRWKLEPQVPKVVVISEFANQRISSLCATSLVLPIPYSL